eukprot:gene25305-10959_t
MKAADADNLKVVAHGRNNFTSWFVADGAISYSSFMTDTLARASGGYGSGLSSSSGSWNASMDGDLASQPPTLASLGVLPPAENEMPTRFVFVRGVHMSAPETNVLNIWQMLGNMWPTALEEDLTNPPGALVSHPGVSALARELFKEIAPHLQTKKPIIFAGHSLGGALGKMLWALSILHGCRPPAQMGVYTYGSPPVLAHTEGGGGERVLEVLGATSSPPVAYVLQHDP